MNNVVYDFAGKVALVTGAASGIGKEIAGLFYAAGATVIVADIDVLKGDKVVEELGNHVSFIQCDVSKNDQVIQMIESIVQQFGRLDIIVNNAGINAVDLKERVTIDQYSELTWKKMIDVDLNGTFYCCKAAAIVMKRQKSGVIINIASVAGVVALQLQIGFVAAKAAIIKMTEAIACELGQYGIRANTVSPGSTLTDATKRLFYDSTGSFSEKAEQLMSFIPQGRPGNASEIANAVIFLASDAASYINGDNLIVDGGWTSGFSRNF